MREEDKLKIFCEQQAKISDAEARKEYEKRLNTIRNSEVRCKIKMF